MAMQDCMAINIYEFTRHSIYSKIIQAPVILSV